jgi:hypothetical protein
MNRERCALQTAAVRLLVTPLVFRIEKFSQAITIPFSRSTGDIVAHYTPALQGAELFIDKIDVTLESLAPQQDQVNSQGGGAGSTPLAMLLRTTLWIVDEGVGKADKVHTVVGSGAKGRLVADLEWACPFFLGKLLTIGLMP